MMKERSEATDIWRDYGRALGGRGEVMPSVNLSDELPLGTTL